MTCVMGWLLFVSLDFFMVIMLLDTTLQVQEISQKSTLPKWTRLNQLENRSYSTIQPPTYPIYIMKIGVWPAILKFFDLLCQKRSGLHTKILTKLVKKLKRHHVIGSTSPVTNPSGVLTNIHLT